MVASSWMSAAGDRGHWGQEAAGGRADPL